VKAMILAAGKGLRMRPLTLCRAKPALPVLNRPLLHWTLELLARHGIRDVVVNLHHLPSSVAEVVGSGRQFGLRVTYSRETRILGTGGGPRRVVDFFGDEPFVLVNGDIVCDFDLRDLVARHRRSGARATLALRPNPDPRRYGPVVTGAHGRILSLAGLPKRSKGRVSLFTGVQVVDPALLRALAPGPSDIVRDLYAPFVSAGGRLAGVRVRGRWWDFGSPALYLASQRAMMSGKAPRFLRRFRAVDPSARIHPRSRVVRSIVGPGAVIQEDAWVVESVVWGGTVVERGARASGSILAGGVLEAGRRASGVVRVPPTRRGRGHEVAL
jgi:mannose-1-phosphate guanylyltransferase